jgi:hypothetical protein
LFKRGCPVGGRAFLIFSGQAVRIAKFTMNASMIVFGFMYYFAH